MYLWGIIKINNKQLELLIKMDFFILVIWVIRIKMVFYLLQVD
jgi:hypothetical protein